MRQILKESKFHCFPVFDAGRTQIAKGSFTVLGFFPSLDLCNEFKNHKLF